MFIAWKCSAFHAFNSILTVRVNIWDIWVYFIWNLHSYLGQSDLKWISTAQHRDKFVKGIIESFIEFSIHCFWNDYIVPNQIWILQFIDTEMVDIGIRCRGSITWPHSHTIHCIECAFIHGKHKYNILWWPKNKLICIWNPFYIVISLISECGPINFKFQHIFKLNPFN